MAMTEKQRAALDERQRIDQAMAIIDAAKRKALAQRAEYGKFLEWKVKMQHRERKQREEEEENLRARIDAKLKAVLDDHRKLKREEVDRWKSFSEAKIRKASSAAHKLEQTEKEAQIEAEKRVQSMSDARRVFLAQQPHSAPATTNATSAERVRGGKASTAVGYDPAVGRVAPPALKAAQPPKESGEPLPQTEAEYFASYPLPDVTPIRATMFGGVDSLTPSQIQKLEAIDVSRRRTESKAALISTMFQTAKSRRLYSTARMLADPPADFLMGNDLMRYIPADIMAQVDRDIAPNVASSPGGDPAFFITEAEEGQPRNTDLSIDVAEKRLVTGPSSKISRWKQYDPHAWMAAAQPPPLPEVPRNREEEIATLQWYKQCCEPLTRIKKRTERHQTHSWQSVPKHVLPPLASARFENLDS